MKFTVYKIDLLTGKSINKPAEFITVGCFSIAQAEFLAEKYAAKYSVKTGKITITDINKYSFAYAMEMYYNAASMQWVYVYTTLNGQHAVPTDIADKWLGLTKEIK